MDSLIRVEPSSILFAMKVTALLLAYVSPLPNSEAVGFNVTTLA